MSGRRNQRSAEAEAYRALYRTKRWHALRTATLRDQPLCALCREQGRIESATVVDHRRAHRGDEALFFDRANLWGLCQPHHDATRQRFERTGIVVGNDRDGRPRDPAHPWNRGR